MKLSSCFKSTYLKENPTIDEILTKYDYENGKSDGLYSKREVSVFVEDSVVGFGRAILGKNKIADWVFKAMDENADEYISIQEIDNYLKKDFGITLDSFKPRKLQNACDTLDKIMEAQKAQKKN